MTQDRISTKADDRQESIFRVGEIVAVSITDAMIVEIDQDVLVVETHDGQQVFIIPGACVTIVRRIPAGGPIRVGDIWADRHGDRWFATCGPDGRPRMTAQRDGSTQTPEWLARPHSPLTLEYRPDTAPVDEDVEGGGDSE